MKISDEKKFDEANVFGKGQANTGFAQYFVGDSFLNPLTNPEETAVFLANVTFEPGCRNNWHIHHADKGGGQLLICTAGEGWYQEEGKPARRLMAGDVVVTHKGIKHWHGATKDSWFEHLAITAGNSEFLEPVTDELYKGLENQ